MKFEIMHHLFPSKKKFPLSHSDFKSRCFFQAQDVPKMALENSLEKKPPRKGHSRRELFILLEVTNNQFLEFGSLNNSPFVGKVQGHVLRRIFFWRTF